MQVTWPTERSSKAPHPPSHHHIDTTIKPTPRPIELLAPARDLDTARAAIQHGADAIYIGAPRFGARAAAGVPLEDIRQLTSEAHRFGVRVYVTVNTILYDHELQEAEQMIWDLYRAGVDALIIQDMGITRMNLPPIPLHSSTQCDTLEPEDVQHLEALGFEQVVLARELNVEQIRRIRTVTTVPLEVFIHGALCVSYSGRCYLSHALTGRSANRGECSQQCRLPYDLIDDEGRKIRTEEHLLSPRDLNRTEVLEQILEAGASSLKIEGRLKGESYVKNITAHYRRELDRIIALYPEKYCRASFGEVSLRFAPDPAKSFNRGFTPYLFHLATPEHPNASVINPLTPKSQGQYLGRARKGRGGIPIDTREELSNGDGLLFVTPEGRVDGLRINRVTPEGGLQLGRGSSLPEGSQVYRNYDQAFERLLASPTAERRLRVSLRLRQLPSTLELEVRSHDDPEHHTATRLEIELEEARNFDPDRLRSELSKLGDTDLVAEEVVLELTSTPFIPLSLLTRLRREAVEEYLQSWDKLQAPLTSQRTQQMKSLTRDNVPARRIRKADYRANISNHLARAYYEAMGYTEPAKAFELAPIDTAELMCTKHCIKHELGYCIRETSEKMPYREPLYLTREGNRLRLEFDCANCQMKIYQA